MDCWSSRDRSAPTELSLHPAACTLHPASNYTSIVRSFAIFFRSMCGFVWSKKVLTHYTHTGQGFMLACSFFNSCFVFFVGWIVECAGSQRSYRTAPCTLQPALCTLPASNYTSLVRSFAIFFHSMCGFVWYSMLCAGCRWSQLPPLSAVRPPFDELTMAHTPDAYDKVSLLVSYWLVLFLIRVLCF